MGEEEVAADSALGVGVGAGTAAEGDHQGRDVAVVEGDDVVEAGVEDGRGAAAVLGRAEDGDGVGGPGLVRPGHRRDLGVDPEEPSGGKQEEQSDEREQESAGGTEGHSLF